MTMLTDNKGHLFGPKHIENKIRAIGLAAGSVVTAGFTGWLE